MDNEIKNKLKEWEVHLKSLLSVKPEGKEDASDSITQSTDSNSHGLLGKSVDSLKQCNDIAKSSWIVIQDSVNENGDAEGISNSKENETFMSPTDQHPRNGPDGQVMDSKTATVSGNGNTKDKPKKPKVQKKSIDTKVDLMSLLEKNRMTKETNALGEPHYYCDLCKYHCHSEKDCNKHFKNDKHRERLKTIKRAEEIQEVVPPSPDHLSHLHEFLHLTVVKWGITADSRLVRGRVVMDLSDKLRQVLPDCQLTMYGSSYTGLGLTTCDVNINVTILGQHSIPKTLTTMKDFLLSEPSLRSRVRFDFTSSWPCVTVADNVTKAKYVLSMGNDKAVRMSQLLLEFTRLDQRVIPLAVIHKHWFQVCKMDDPHRGITPACLPTILTVYFLQNTTPPVLPVPTADLSLPLTNDWSSVNKDTIATLWLQLLKFYASDFDYSQYVISLKQKCLKMSSKTWRVRNFAVEDPVDTQKNIVWECQSNSVMSYLVDCYLRSYKYFATGRTPSPSQAHTIKTVPRNNHITNSQDDRDDCPLDHRGRDHSESGSDSPHSDVNSDIDTESGSSDDLFDDEYKQIDEHTNSFQFRLDTIANGKGPRLVCSLCHRCGHIKTKCPSTHLPPLQPIPDPDNEFKNIITDVIGDAEDQLGLTKMDMKYRDDIVSFLQRFIRADYPDAHLQLFGSSCNGFGFYNSDLDISMTFDSQPNTKNLNCTAIITDLARILRRHRCCDQVLDITTAKVPIVKFTYVQAPVIPSGPRPPPLEGDISLYNIVALENTKLLQAYVKIDPRVSALGFAIKILVKVCGIGDASRGSLSSYAYILMLLHYLQHTTPPVIPVLQELHGTERKTRLVDGHDTWFFDDLQSLKNVWPEWGKNRQSLADLWIGLLRYYTETFDFDNHVISIRQFEYLMRFEKLWNTQCIAIEDPFVLTHNLGAGLSHSMSCYIMKSFRKARGHFCKGVPRLSPQFFTWADYLFNKASLTDGPQPTDKRCSICGKIGHMFKACPMRRRRKEKPPKKTQERKSAVQNATSKSKSMNDASSKKKDESQISSICDKSNNQSETSPVRNITVDSRDKAYHSQHNGEHSKELGEPLKLANEYKNETKSQNSQSIVKSLIDPDGKTCDRKNDSHLSIEGKNKTEQHSDVNIKMSEQVNNGRTKADEFKEAGKKRKKWKKNKQKTSPQLRDNDWLPPQIHNSEQSSQQMQQHRNTLKKKIGLSQQIRECLQSKQPPHPTQQSQSNTQPNQHSNQSPHLRQQSQPNKPPTQQSQQSKQPPHPTERSQHNTQPNQQFEHSNQPNHLIQHSQPNKQKTQQFQHGTQQPHPNQQSQPNKQLTQQSQHSNQPPHLIQSLPSQQPTRQFQNSNQLRDTNQQSQPGKQPNQQSQHIQQPPYPNQQSHIKKQPIQKSSHTTHAYRPSRQSQPNKQPTQQSENSNQPRDPEQQSQPNKQPTKISQNRDLKQYQSPQHKQYEPQCNQPNQQPQHHKQPHGNQQFQYLHNQQSSQYLKHPSQIQQFQQPQQTQQFQQVNHPQLSKQLQQNQQSQQHDLNQSLRQKEHPQQNQQSQQHDLNQSLRQKEHPQQNQQSQQHDLNQPLRQKEHPQQNQQSQQHDLNQPLRQKEQPQQNVQMQQHKQNQSSQQHNQHQNELSQQPKLPQPIQPSQQSKQSQQMQPLQQQFIQHVWAPQRYHDQHHRLSNLYLSSTSNQAPPRHNQLPVRILLQNTAPSHSLEAWPHPQPRADHRN